MFALLRQLSKLLLLVFNLPQVLSLLGNLFKITPGENGRLELGIVDTIARAVVAEDVQRLRQEVQEGKQREIEEVEQETEQLKSIYSGLEPEAREFFTQQAEARRVRRIASISNRSPNNIINERVITQLVNDKKKQLEPAIVPALAPITALLGIPIFVTKLSDYVAQASGFAGGITSKETADGRASSYTSEFDDGTGDQFNGPVGEGDLDITFNGVINNQDFKLLLTSESGDVVTLNVNGGQLPYRADLVQAVGFDEVPDLLSTGGGELVGAIDIRGQQTDSLGTVFRRLLKQQENSRFEEETELVVRIRSSDGLSSTVRIPLEIWFGPDALS